MWTGRELSEMRKGGVARKCGEKQDKHARLKKRLRTMW